MKKILALALAAMMLAGCSSTSTSTSTAASTGTDTSASTSTAAPAADPTYVLQFSATGPEHESYSVTLKQWGDKIMEATNGDVAVEMYYNNVLGENDDIVEQAIAGAPIMAGTDPSRLSSYVPEFGIIQMPYLMEDYTDINKVVETPLYASWVEELETKGLKLCAGNWFSGTRNYLLNKEINTPADLEGLRVRTIGNDICIGTVNKMGAVGTAMPMTEVYQSIQLKALEGTEIQSTSIYAMRMYEVCNVLNKTEHFQLIADEVMGTIFFDTLPEEYQQVILETGKEMGTVSQEMMAADSEKYEKEMVEQNGLTIHEIEDLTPFIEATESLYEELGYAELRDQLFEEMAEVA